MAERSGEKVLGFYDGTPGTAGAAITLYQMGGIATDATRTVRTLAAHERLHITDVYLTCNYSAVTEAKIFWDVDGDQVQAHESFAVMHGGYAKEGGGVAANFRLEDDGPLGTGLAIIGTATAPVFLIVHGFITSN